ncbi:MAG TPA: M23 family metallopeptidase, partial [Chloroflexia bacterium]|nr:M23 family metallopeptidase [Chloroflexia bacterium]
RFNLPMGLMVRINPPVLAEGHSAVVEVAATEGMTVTGEYEGRSLLFKSDPARGVSWAMLGAVPFADLGTRAVTVTLQNGNGGRQTVTRNLRIIPYPFPSESLQFDPDTSKLLDPALTGKELETLGRIFSGRTPEKLWAGQFRMPLDGKIRTTSIFATRRCYSCPDGSKPTTYHGGMDMAAAEGSAVHAPAAGTVVLAERLAVRGNVVIIDHGMGVYSLFAHNSEFVAAVGQRVEKGDVVSLSGNTGLSNGPHLHWELHVSGPPVDPVEWVNRAMP